MAQYAEQLPLCWEMKWDVPPADFRYVLFERVEPEENANRFYYLAWQPTLLDRQAVVRMYGRKGESQFVVPPRSFNSLAEAWPLVRSVIKKRLKRGYQVVLPKSYR
jgi:predicted DNA-binding WGR domain protein